MKLDRYIERIELAAMAYNVPAYTLLINSECFHG